MGERTHMQELKKEVHSWNEWRKGNPDVVPDLSGEDLRTHDLRKYDLRKANLRCINLRDADLRDADLRDANLRDANLSEAQVGNADLSSADLLNIAIAGTNLLDARLWDGGGACHRWRSEKREPVHSVCDLVHRCKELSYSNGSDKVLYFRGVKSASYKLEPSLARALPHGRGNLVPHEGEMLLDIMSKRPEDFMDRTTALEQWSLARHHWLPTRLLDITKNPLVALYGACEDTDRKIEICDACKAKLCDPCNDQALCDDCRKKVCAEQLCADGMVHVFAVRKQMIKTFASDTVSVIANFAKLPQRKQRLILGKSGNVDDYYRARGDLYHQINAERPNFQELIDPRHLLQVFVVEPRESFERVRAQSGAFLISALHSAPGADNENGDTAMEFEPESIEKRVGSHNRGMPMYGHYTFRVPSSIKGEIRKDLELLNVTQETLFPGLDSAAKGAQMRAEKRVEEEMDRGRA